MDSHVAPSKIFALPIEIATTGNTYSSQVLEISGSNEHAQVDRDVKAGNMHVTTTSQR